MALWVRVPPVVHLKEGIIMSNQSSEDNILNLASFIERINQYEIDFKCPKCNAIGIAPKIKLIMALQEVEVIEVSEDGNNKTIQYCGFYYNEELFDVGADKKRVGSFDVDNVELNAEYFRDFVVKHFGFGCTNLNCGFMFKQRSEKSLIKFLIDNKYAKYCGHVNHTFTRVS